MRLDFNSEDGTIQGALILTPNHILLVEGETYKQAKNVTVGTRLKYVQNCRTLWCPINAVHCNLKSKCGIYGPATFSGTIVVDGIGCSAYAKPSDFAEVPFSDGAVHHLCHGASAPCRWYWWARLHLLPKKLVASSNPAGPTGSHPMQRFLKWLTSPLILLGLFKKSGFLHPHQVQ